MSEEQELSELSSEQALQTAQKHLEEILAKMAVSAEVRPEDTEDKLILEICCDTPETIIGRRGQVIDALQHLVGKMTYGGRSAGRGKPIIVDADGYRDKAIDRLKELAIRTSEKALETQSAVKLNPMSAHDRRIVHMALADVPGVNTRSEGNGQNRRVLVEPVADA